MKSILPKALQSRTAAVVHDLIAVPVAWYLAFWLRFNLDAIPPPFFDTASRLLPVVCVIQAFSFWYFGLYRGVWRFASIPDFVRIGKSVVCGVAASMFAIFLMTRMQYVPRSVFPLHAILLLGVLGGDRLIYRWLKERPSRLRSGRRVLVVGAGEGAAMLIRDMLRRQRDSWVPVVIVDDDPKKRGIEIHGIRVEGATVDMPEIVRRYGVQLILIAIPSLASEPMRKLVAICESCGVPFRTLPRLEDLVSGQVTVNALREVQIEDLLGREHVELDRENVRAGLSGRKVLVTGAGGSIGAELCRQIAGLAPASLIMLERSEYALYTMQREIRRRNTAVNAEAVLGDVCDRDLVDRVVRDHAPDMIFHAAAYKQVPLLQSHIREAVRNNVLGTRIVADAAERHGCEKFVFISSDKAVNPANVLGATKRAGEILCEWKNRRSKTRFLTVRFGNVLGSAGSVVPLFHEQIRGGGPVTVTHPEVTRYFMTIREACALILQAAVMGSGGEIFVLDMGEPVRIGYLAEQMIRLSGLTPGRDIRVEYVGLRPGEKLYEELFYQDEVREKTANEKILIASHKPVDWGQFEACLRDLERGAQTLDEREMQEALKKIVPQLGPPAPGDGNVVALAKRGS